MKKAGKDIEEDRCMRGKDRRLGFNENNRKNHMEEIMKKENDWDHMTDVGMLEGLVKNTC